jgi:hypothetical protein
MEAMGEHSLIYLRRFMVIKVLPFLGVVYLGAKSLSHVTRLTFLFGKWS